MLTYSVLFNLQFNPLRVFKLRTELLSLKSTLKWHRRYLAGAMPLIWVTQKMTTQHDNSTLEIVTHELPFKTLSDDKKPTWYNMICTCSIGRTCGHCVCKKEKPNYWISNLLVIQVCFLLEILLIDLSQLLQSSNYISCGRCLSWFHRVITYHMISPKCNYQQQNCVLECLLV